MNRIRHIIQAGSRKDAVTIYILADLHLGAAASDEKHIRDAVREIEESGAYWIGLGDMVDAIGRQDKRSREGLLAPWLHGETRIWSAQRRYLAELLRPIGGQCLAYLKGNHEEYVEAGGIDLYYSVAEEADIPEDRLLGMSGFIRLAIRRGEGGNTTTYTIYAHHGWGGGELLGGHALKLERMPSRYTADIYMMGHGHRALMARSIVEGYGGLREIVMLEAPSFLRKYVKDETTYPERRGLPSTACGAAILRLWPDMGRTIHVEV